MRPSKSALAGLVALVLGVSAASQWWAGRHQQSVAEEVAAMAAPGDIHMISSQTCGSCIVARRWFTEHGVAYSECVIEQDAVCRADFEARRAPGTPVLVVRGQPQLGFSPERLRDTLKLGG